MTKPQQPPRLERVLVVALQAALDREEALLAKIKLLQYRLKSMKMASKLPTPTDTDTPEDEIEQ
ncbi:MAG: hypothetical protein HUK20_13175 [Fibrobacter sp.]|nr:hypothetical protein [Fibrobacter sp.]